jgi:hypothetical protein
MASWLVAVAAHRRDRNNRVVAGRREVRSADPSRCVVSGWDRELHHWRGRKRLISYEEVVIRRIQRERVEVGEEWIMGEGGQGFQDGESQQRERPGTWAFCRNSG